jgi:hypothetical protein
MFIKSLDKWSCKSLFTRVVIENSQPFDFKRLRKAPISRQIVNLLAYHMLSARLHSLNFTDPLADQDKKAIATKLQVKLIEAGRTSLRLHQAAQSSHKSA